MCLLCLSGATGGCRTVIDPIAIRDAQTGAQIKTALVNDAELGATTIAVSVTGGVAHLSGTVASRTQVDRAVSLARSVAGVRDVTNTLTIGPADPPPPSTVPPGPRPREQPQSQAFEPQGDPRLFAVGASVGWGGPRASGLGSHVGVGPLLRFGSPRGFGPAIAFDWFQITMAGTSGDPDVISRIHLRPLMAGVGYTWASERVSVSPSLVAGVAFNSVTVPETGEPGRIAVEADNSFIWRPGVSLWFDLNRHFALNLSAGYAMTGLHVTVLEDGRLVKQRLDGDTAIVHAGLAYKLF